MYKSYINKFKSPNLSTFVVLNGVYRPDLSDRCEEGLKIDQENIIIEKKTKLKHTVHLLFLSSKNCANKINIMASSESSFQLLEEHASLDDNSSYIHDFEINIVAEASSNIVYCKIQNENNLAMHKAYTTIRQKQNSKFISKFAACGAKKSTDELKVILTEKDACYEAIGIISLHNEQNLCYQAQIEHRSENCTSSVLFKGLVDDKARGNFSCLVVVNPDAIKTTSHVTSNNLVLSEKATMTALPGFETYNDDIICAHSSGIGHLEEEAVFYLRSRGINEGSAMKLLTYAFVSEVFEQFADYCKDRVGPHLTKYNFIYEY